MSDPVPSPPIVDGAAVHGEHALDLCAEVAHRYQIADLEPLISLCRSQAAKQQLNIAVFGRFKAGKSSFLNHFLGQDTLPVGVVPVTSVVTELSYAAEESATVHFADGRVEPISLAQICDYVSEARNPENKMAVSEVKVGLPAVNRLRAIRFVDTPGLQSVFSHNTETSLAWSPNVDLALVAVAVDPPLSREDIGLIKRLYDYTPNVSLLVTKIDTLSESDLGQVLAFMRQQLERNVSPAPRIFPYSIKPGYEQLREKLAQELILPAVANFNERRGAVFQRKVETLLREAGDYLSLSLRSAETTDAEKRRLASQFTEENAALEDTKLQLKLIARHNAGATRRHISAVLSRQRPVMDPQLQEDLRKELEGWHGGFARSLETFEKWLRSALTDMLSVVSNEHYPEFLRPLEETEKQYVRLLQNFRDRLSENVQRIFGVSLHTTQTEIKIQPPRSPDIRIGRSFDHNWELISWLIPMWLFRSAVEHRFREKVSDQLHTNLSRLESQWEEVVTKAIWQLQKDAETCLDDLMQTVSRLLLSAREQVPQITQDLARLRDTKSKCACK